MTMGGICPFSWWEWVLITAAAVKFVWVFMPARSALGWSFPPITDPLACSCCVLLGLLLNVCVCVCVCVVGGDGRGGGRVEGEGAGKREWAKSGQWYSMH